MSRRPILLALLVAGLTTGAFVWFVRSGPGAGTAGATEPARAGVGQQAPAILGATLDGAAFDLATTAGKPVVINFWGPSCVPCRDEFPLLEAKQARVRRRTA